MSAPWFKFYAKDWLADAKVKMLPREVRSMLIDLWCYCVQDGSIPSDKQMLKQLLSESDEAFATAYPMLLPFFVEDGGRLFSNRLRAETDKYNEKCEKLRANASIGGANAQAIAKAKRQAKSTEPEPEPEKDITPTPSGAKRGRKSKREKLGSTYSPEVVKVCNQVKAITPPEDKQERQIRVDMATLAFRVAELFRAHPGWDAELLIQAWADYLATRPAWLKAPQYFFGKAKDQGDSGANYEPYVAMLLHKRSRVSEPQLIPVEVAS